MPDPGLIFDSSIFVANALKRWLAAGELDRLVGLLDRRFGDDTGLTVPQLQVWAQDEGFRQVLFFISETGDWETHADILSRSVLGLIASDPSAPEAHESALAQDVVGAIRELLPKAKQGDDLVRFEANRTRAELLPARVRLSTIDWAPQRAKDIVKELFEANPVEGEQLERTLKDRDVPAVVQGLITDQPRWVREGTGLLFEALAAIAEGTGQWSIALQGWQEAAEHEGSDRVRALVKASTAAHMSGDGDLGARLLDRAGALDPEHPLVLLMRVRLMEDPNARLQALERAKPGNARQAAAVDSERADAFRELGRFEEADAALVDARAKDPYGPRVKEVAAEVTVTRNQQVWLKGELVDVAALLESARTFQELRAEHLELRAYGPSLMFLGRAVHAYVRADRSDLAGQLLEIDTLSDEELSMENAREYVAELALNADRPDLVAELLPDSADGDVALLMRATAAIHLGEDASVVRAVETLDGLVRAGEYKTQAALARLIASAEWKASWSDAAEAQLREDERVLTALLKAKWLTNEERWADAERELMPYFDEPRVQHQLTEVALAQGDNDKVALRALDLLKKNPDYAVRMSCAMALLKVNRRDDAIQEFVRLGESDLTPAPLRVAAYANLTRLALEDQRFRAALDLTAEWLALGSNDRRAGWSRVQALFRLGYFDEAALVMQDLGLQPQAVNEAQLAGRIYALTLPARQALEALIGLADDQERPNEDLEGLLVTAALSLRMELPDDVAERASPERFIEAFPESRLIQAIPVPRTDEEVKAFLEQLAGNHDEAIREAQRGVFEVGDTPVAVLAFATRSSVGEMWSQLSLLPLSYGDEQLEELERLDALKAIAVGAVWDPSSLFVVSRMDRDTAQCIRQALPKSAIAQSVLDDCLVKRASSVAGDSAERPRADAVEGTLSMAQGMEVEPDTLLEDDSQEAAFLRREDLAMPLKTYPATFAVARRLGLPVFSDDRFIRLRARQAGVPSFGALALLDALRVREHIDPIKRLQLREHLRALGALGSNPSRDELAAEARAHDFRLTRGLRVAFFDKTAFRQAVTNRIRTYVAFLQVVHQERSDEFERWVVHILDAMARAVPEAPLKLHAGNLVVLTWTIDGEGDVEFFRAVIRAVKKAGAALGPVGDPVLTATQELVSMVEEETGFSPAARLQVLRDAIDQLPIEERNRVRLAVFVPILARITQLNQMRAQ